MSARTEGGYATRVFFPCTGLGREQRGFEAFTRECAAALAGRNDLDITVFSGGGDVEPGEREVWNLPRSGIMARALGAILDRDPYFVEQVSFFAGFASALTLQNPDLVYFADLSLGNACWHWRRLTGRRYRLLYYNGGATTRPFTRCDLVQQVSPEHFDAAIARGEPRERQVLVPHGVRIAREYAPPTREEVASLRMRLGLPLDRPVVLSVGMLDVTVKRLDYLIAEVATMPSRPHLLLLGAETAETPVVRATAAERLGHRCTIRTLPRAQVLTAYRAADVFVLASLREGFGLAQVEALAAGLACIAHDTPTSAYVLGPHRVKGDLRVPGVLAPLLEHALSQGRENAVARHAHAYDKFAWDRLEPQYAELLQAAAAARTPRLGEGR